MSPPSAPDGRIVLLGLRGAGKTTVGSLLARRLGLPWFDTDLEVAARVAPPADLIALGRVDELREAEAAVVAELARLPSAVISLGGGAIESPGVRAALRPFRAILLDAPDPELARRIESDRAERPPLTDLPLLAEIRTLRARRFALYTALDPMIIATAGRPPEEVAAEIGERLAAERLRADPAGGDGRG